MGHVQSRRPQRRRVLVAVATAAVTALLAGACTDGPDLFADHSAPPPPAEVSVLDASAEAAQFRVQPSVEQVAVTGAEPDTDLALHDERGVAVATGRTDDAGALIFRTVDPAAGYRVATIERRPEASEPFEVVPVEGSVPDQSFYDSQQLVEGFNYITTRDGTTLSASVYLPGPVEEGPYPTVVEYSGYSPSKPATNLISDRWDDIKKGLPEGMTKEQVCEIAPFACEAADQPGSLLAQAMGYAVVGVNMRGTGCSGGAYDFFEPLQILDGYDVIETVAAQDWVLDHRVGMVGLSYPGIAQLFVAAANPPSLAAITPLSVYDDTVRGVLAPGGIFNEGFALEWAESVLDSAEPYGQGWERDRVDDGDETCARNQELRGQNVDAVEKARRHAYYPTEIADPLNPSLFVQRIEAAVFLGGAFQDEQTGGRFPHLFDDFDSARVAKFNAWNGAHADGFAPVNLVEWKTFLDFYVAEELTERPPVFDLFAPLIMDEVFGVDLVLPPQRMFTEHDSFEAKRAAYEAEPAVRILFESGAGDPKQPGAPVPTAEVFADAWPISGTEAVSWYLQADGSLTREPQEGSGTSASRFLHDPSLGSLRTVEEGDPNDLFKADVKYDWQQEPAGSASVFVSEPLEQDLVMIGSANADLWLRTSADDADVGVTLSEVRPDGMETYVQSGLLRTSHRALADSSTELMPVHEGLEEEAEPMPSGEFARAQIEVLPFAHVFRAGSRIRLSVHTPGGDRPRWSYILLDQPDGTTIDVGHSAQTPSRLVLPVIPGITGYPPAVPENCHALRAQPCRKFVEYDNRLVDGQGSDPQRG